VTPKSGEKVNGRKGRDSPFLGAERSYLSALKKEGKKKAGRVRRVFDRGKGGAKKKEENI